MTTTPTLRCVKFICLFVAYCNFKTDAQSLHFVSEPACVSPFVPTLAMLFITRGHLPHEALWADWLSEGTYEVFCGNETRFESFLNTYVHAPPEFEGYKNDSFFRDKIIHTRVPVKWEQHTSAERELLRAALDNPSNHRFILVSESCIPLYPANIVYLQVMTTNRSSIACLPEMSRFVMHSCTISQRL